MLQVMTCPASCSCDLRMGSRASVSAPNIQHLIGNVRSQCERESSGKTTSDIPAKDQLGYVANVALTGGGWVMGIRGL